MKKLWITACDAVCEGWVPLCHTVGEDNVSRVTLFASEQAAASSIMDVLEEQIAEVRDGSRAFDEFGTDEVPIEVDVNDDLTFEFEGKSYQGVLDEEPDVVTDGSTWTG